MKQMITEIRRATREPKDRLNILAAPTHERYQSLLARTGHNFYLYGHESFVRWKTKYAPLPSNHFILNEGLGENQIPPDIEFDLVLAQHRFSQHQILTPFAKERGIASITLEHTYPNFSQQQLYQWRQLRSDLNCFITQASLDAWGWSGDPTAMVIPHAVNTDVFKPDRKIKKDMKVSVVANSYIERSVPLDYPFFQETIKGVEQDIKIIGDTPGLSKPAKDTEELVDFCRSSWIHINTARFSPMPMSVLENLALGSVVIARRVCGIPEYIQDGHNGFLVETPEQMRSKIKECQQDVEMCKEIGRNARKTILEKCKISDFVKRWDEVFRSLT